MNEQLFNQGQEQKEQDSQPNRYIEQAERKKKLAELFSVGLTKKEDIIGYHGTSLESLKYLIDKGYLPGSTGAASSVEHPSGRIYFFPVDSKVAYLNLDSYKAYGFIKDDEEAIDATTGYAGDIARGHYLVTALGFDLESREVVSMARDLCIFGRADDEWEKAHGFFLSKGIDEKKLEATILVAKERKGVVLALSKESLLRHTVGLGDLGERDLHLDVPGGLYYNDLAGLKPLGESEIEFFKKLQKD